jgi:Mg2+/citrate symporter
MRLRHLVEIIAAFVLLFVASSVGPVVGLVLIVTAFALVLDAGTAWFASATGTGGMTDYKQ